MKEKREDESFRSADIGPSEKEGNNETTQKLTEKRARK